MRLSRHQLGAVGVALVGLALAARLAFFSWSGLALLLTGFALVGWATLRPGTSVDDRASAYIVLFGSVAVVAALAPFYPGRLDPGVAALTLAAPVAFFLFSASPRLAPYRLYATAALLIAAHGVFIAAVRAPEHQDVFKFLNLGVDVLLKGHDPYGPISVADGGPFRYTYPPGALLVLAPFRILLGDVRWGYLLAEGVVVLGLARLLQRHSPPPVRMDGSHGRPHVRHPVLSPWQDALILTPLALPRTSQAFFVFSNHEWVLLALAVIALGLALRPNWVLAGVVLGLGIAAKQYFIVFPALFLLPAVRRRSMLLGIAIAGALALPFLVWDAGGFVDNVFGNLGAPPDPDRLTLWAALHDLGFGAGRSGAALLAALGAAIAVGLLWVSRRNLPDALLACGLALAAFALCASFAAYNYYAYALAFCTWGLLIPPDWERRQGLAGP
jgi:hypothetical protein